MEENSKHSAELLERCEIFYGILKESVYNVELYDFQSSVNSSLQKELLEFKRYSQSKGKEFLTSFENTIKEYMETIRRKENRANFFLLPSFEKSFVSAGKEFLLRLEKSAESGTDFCLKDMEELFSNEEERLKNILESLERLRRDILDFPYTQNLLAAEEKMKKLKADTGAILSNIVYESERILGKKNEENIISIFPSFKEIMEN